MWKEKLSQNRVKITWEAIIAAALVIAALIAIHGKFKEKK